MDLSGIFDEYERAALEAIADAADADSLEAVRIEFLGKKKGRLRDLQSSLGKAPPEQRPLLGKRFNAVKNAVSEALDKQRRQLSRPKSALTGIDIK